MIAVNDGREHVGILKRAVDGGFEAFVERDGRDVYLAKVATLSEGRALILAARANPPARKRRAAR